MSQTDREASTSPNFDFNYIESKACKWTFQPQKVRRFVESRLKGRVLNLFAGQTKLRYNGEIVRNDLDESKDADYHVDAMQCATAFENHSFDTVILDPPYNVRKSREKYEGEYMGAFRRVKDQVQELVKPDGKVITFGYSSTAMGKTREFTKEEVVLINHKGDINDTIVVVERRMSHTINSYKGDA